MEREKFERSWRKAFEKAEVNPSDQVWTNIELELERQRGGELKHRILFYKMLAAASVVFAITAGTIGYYQFDQMRLSNQLAVQNEKTPDPAVMPNNERVDRADGDKVPDKPETARDDREDSGADQREIDISHPLGPRNSAGQPSGESHVAALSSDRATIMDQKSEVLTGRNDRVARILDDELPLRLEASRLPPLYSSERRFDSALRHAADESTAGIDPVAAMLARLDQREKELAGESDQREREDDESTHEQFWTSIGLAAGTFNPVHASTSGMRTLSESMQSVAAPIVDQEARASGQVYSMGVNVGTRIASRWVLQGGVNYLTHASEYTADNIVMTTSGYSARFMAVSSNALVKADDSELSQKIVYSAPYTVNNNLRYLSIPMQAGYLLIDKAFGLQVNAGVATDLFLQNTVKADSEQLAKNSQPAGEDSPYRAVNLSGLLGTEFSYRMGEHYRISINPGIRYPFNTIYKSELGIQSTPVTFDIGLRFRYIFH